MFLLLVTAACTTLGPHFGAKRDELFRRQVSSFVDRIRADPHAPPGFVVVATTSNSVVFEGAHGMRDLATGAPMTLDTPIYNASVTKAYTGLLASILDEEGVLPIGTSLADVWPGLTLPDGLDADAITMGELLAHTSRIRAGGLIFRSVTTGEVTAADVPTHLARYATARQAGFSYSNTGPFIYSAAVEARTAEPWRAALQRHVLDPLGLSETSASLEAFQGESVAHCHGWISGSWRSLRHKPTVTMNAAGGMYASGRDSARFLQAFLSEGASTGGRVSATALRQTWRRAAEQDNTLWGLHRDGYGLGWDLGERDGRRFVSRSGGYAGCRSMILFLPDEDFGIAVLSVGDAAANTFNAAILRHAIDLWTSHPQVEQRAQSYLEEYAEAAEKEMARLAAAEAALPPRAPVDTAYAQAVIGAYENERLGRVGVANENGQLVAFGGAFTADLLRVDGDRFLIVSRQEADDAQTFTFRRSIDGTVRDFLWDDDPYHRIMSK